MAKPAIYFFVTINPNDPRLNGDTDLYTDLDDACAVARCWSIDSRKKCYVFMVGGVAEFEVGDTVNEEIFYRI